MLSNIFLFNSLKKHKNSESKLVIEGQSSLYNIFNNSELKTWDVIINKFDIKKISDAQKNGKEVKISPYYSDVQLLKLHIPEKFLDFDYVLIYHKLFGVYEIKNKHKTEFMFSYNCGKYTPLMDLF